MAPVSKRLNSFSYGSVPTIEISDEQFTRLEHVYGRPLNVADRAEIGSLANRYLYWHGGELITERYSEVRHLFEKVRGAVTPFWQFASGSMLGISGPSNELEHILSTQYARFPIGLNARHISAVGDDGSREATELPGQVVIELNSSVLMEVAESLVCAINRADAEIRNEEQNGSKGLAPGGEFREWLMLMRAWAKERRYPFGAFRSPSKSDAHGEADKTPSRFAELLFELNRMFKGVNLPDRTAADGRPITLEEPVLSVDAMADRLRKTVAAANRRKQKGGMIEAQFGQ